MSLKQNAHELAKQRLPVRGNRISQGIDHTGLRKRPQMEQIVNYLDGGQERVKFPDREAKLIRNHPFMTQLDFFDMQEEQQRAWEEEKRKHEAEIIAKEKKTSNAMVAATQPKDAEAQVAIVSSEEIDDEAMRADSIYEYELEQNQTADWRKKESNAQTMRFNLAVQTGNPSWQSPYHGHEPSAPPPPSDYGDDEHSGAEPSSGPSHRLRLNGKTSVGLDGERIPDKLLRGVANLASRAGSGVIDYVFDPTGARAAAAATDKEEREFDNARMIAMRENSTMGWISERAQHQQESWDAHVKANSIAPKEEFSIATPREDRDEKHKSGFGSGWAHGVGAHIRHVGEKIIVHNPATGYGIGAF